jgi:hypothetical protein
VAVQAVLEAALAAAKSGSWVKVPR